MGKEESGVVVVVVRVCVCVWEEEDGKRSGEGKEGGLLFRPCLFCFFFVFFFVPLLRG